MSETPVAYNAAEPVPSHPRTTPAVRWLIALNVAVYFLQLTVIKAADIQQALGFQKENLGHQWWTIVTFMFVHGSAWHLALDMYVLWMFGPRLEARWGWRSFVRFYVFCGLGAWFAHLALVGGDSVLTGATGSVLGVLLAYTSFWPDERALLFGTVPTTVRWIAVFMGATMIGGGMAWSGSPNTMAYLAHLGGLAAAAVYLRTIATVNLTRFRQGVSPVPDEPDDLPPRAVPRALPRTRATKERETIDDVVARSNAAVAKHAAPPKPAPPSEPQDDLKMLNRLLDKISAKGLDSLSLDERVQLEDASRRMRKP